MAVIDDLIAKISDEALKQRISEEVRKLSKQKKFGLVVCQQYSRQFI